MTNKHPKHSGRSMLTYYTQPADQDDFDTLDNFDDRTLRSLVGKVDEPDVTKTLGLGRWQDRFK